MTTDYRYIPDVTLHVGAVIKIAGKVKDSGACLRWTLDEVIQCGMIEAHTALTDYYDQERGTVSTFLYRVLKGRIIRQYCREHGRLVCKKIGPYATDYHRAEEFTMTDVTERMRFGEDTPMRCVAMSREQSPVDAAIEAEEREILLEAVADSIAKRKRSPTARIMEDCFTTHAKTQAITARRNDISNWGVRLTLRAMEREAREYVEENYGG